MSSGSDVVSLLLAANAAVSQADKQGVSPLYVAAQEDHTETVRRLLAAGAEVDQANKTDGGFPLFVAAQNGHAEPMRLLLANGADVNKVKQDGASTLHIAAQDGDLELVRLLLNLVARLQVLLERREVHLVESLQQPLKVGPPRTSLRSPRQLKPPLLQRGLDVRLVKEVG